MPMLENMAKRRSVRTYSPEKVEAGLKDALLEYAGKNGTGPFGNTIRFIPVEIPQSDSDELKFLGTYGMIRGATLYLAGSVKKAPFAMEDFGYCMEKAVLKATELGLGTCWLGGSLNRGNFSSRTGLLAGEVIPAVTPVGYAGDNPRLWESTVRLFIGANNRKPFNTLFFSENEAVSLNEEPDDPVSQALNAVRIAPSASNKQPWRIIQKGQEFHFYMDEDKPYNSVFKDIKIQNLDMGIAMAHFELAMNELGRSGSWKPGADALKEKRWEPIAKWIMK
jgi:nitroreductase